MPASLLLMDGLQNGEIVRIKMAANDVKGPTTRRHWLILEGIINHITGTKSIMWKDYKLTSGGITSAPKGWVRCILAASASGTYNLLSNVPENPDCGAGVINTMNPMLVLPIILDDEAITLAGDATVSAYITVLEW